jgi:hypothetical protein
VDFEERGSDPAKRASKGKGCNPQISQIAQFS